MLGGRRFAPMRWASPGHWSSEPAARRRSLARWAGTRASTRWALKASRSGPRRSTAVPSTVIASTGEVGTLHGTFHFLRLLQTGRSVSALDIAERPRLARRLLNHWDNLDGSIERGYAGRSLWNWNELPGSDRPARGGLRARQRLARLNGTVVNSVNANPKSLSADYLKKAAALADTFRPYGIRLYLAANFAAPKMLGELQTHRSARSRGRRVVAREGRRDLSRSSPTSAASWSRPTARASRARRTTSASHADGANVLADCATRRTAASSCGARLSTTPTSTPTVSSGLYLEFVPLDDTFHDQRLRPGEERAARLPATRAVPPAVWRAGRRR